MLTRVGWGNETDRERDRGRDRNKDRDRVMKYRSKTDRDIDIFFFLLNGFLLSEIACSTTYNMSSISLF